MNCIKTVDYSLQRNVDLPLTSNFNAFSTGASNGAETIQSLFTNQFAHKRKSLSLKMILYCGQEWKLADSIGLPVSSTKCKKQRQSRLAARFAFFSWTKSKQMSFCECILSPPSPWNKQTAFVTVLTRNYETSLFEHSFFVSIPVASLSVWVSVCSRFVRLIDFDPKLSRSY